MKHTLISAAFLLSSLLLNAQQEKQIVYSEAIDEKDRLISLIGQSDKELYVLSKKSDNFAVRIFDKNTLFPIGSAPVEVQKIKNRSLAIDQIEMLGGKPVIFSSAHTPDMREYNVYMNTLDSKGEFQPEGRLIFTNPERPTTDKENVLIKCAEDQQSFMIVKPVFISMKTLKFYYACYKADGTLLYESSVEHLLDAKKEEFLLTNLLPEGNNKFALVFANYYYDKSIKTYKSSLHIHRINAEEKDPGKADKLTILDIPHKALVRELLISSHENKLILTGHYLASNKKSLTGIKGVFRYVMEDGKESGTLAMVPYQNGIRQKALKGFENAEKMDVPFLYSALKTYNDTSGNTYLITERQTMRPLPTGLYEYYFGSLIITKVNASGETVYQSFIPKSQFYKQVGIPIFILPTPIFSVVFFTNIKRDTRQYLSHYSTFKNDQLYLVFNDDMKNEKRTDIRENLTNPANSAPVVVKVSADGKYTYEMQKDWRDEQTIVQFSNSIETEDGSGLYFLSSDKKIEKLGILNLD